MRRFRSVRRGAIAVAIVVALLNLGGIQFVRDAYPADPFKAEALAKCIAADSGFVRFFAYERSRCYARQPRVTSQYSPGAPFPEHALSTD